MPNIGRNAQAHIIGGVNLIEPPHRDINRQVNKITEGIEINVVVVWKKVEIAGPIPVMYMWCAQTMKERNPRTSTPYTIDLYPQIGRRVLTGIISATQAIAGSNRT